MGASRQHRRAARRRLGVWVAGMGLALAGCGGALHGTRSGSLTLGSPLPLPGGARQLVVVGDLHLGIGKQGDHWDPYEDFRWADALERFLATIDQQGGGATDLVLNGDTFELWQSRRGDCASPDPDVGCSQAEALGRLGVVAAAHARELRLIGSFAMHGDNRVVMLPGNHDAALLFPPVAQAVLAASGATASRLIVSTTGAFLSVDGRVFAEHGHQTGLDDLNSFDGWPAPFLDRPGGPFLRRPWGEQFVRDFFDRYEDRYPVLDNILPLSAAARYGVASEQVAGGTAAAQTFLQLLLKQTSARQAGKALSGYLEGLGWDVAGIRGQGDWLLSPAVLPSGDPLTGAVAAAQAAGTLGRTVARLTDSQIRQLCDQRLITNALEIGQAQRPATCPTIDGPAAAAQALQRSRDSILADHIAALNRARKAQRGLTRPLELFIYSHTHMAVAPYPLTLGATSPTVVNTGAWQRTTGPHWVEDERTRRGLSLAATLPALQLEDLPACYPFVRVAPYPPEQNPRAQLLSFRDDGGGRIDPAPCPE